MPLVTPLALAEQLDALGRGGVLDQPVAAWLDARSGTFHHVIRRMTASHAIPSLRALLGTRLVWDALGASAAQILLDDLAEWASAPTPVAAAPVLRRDPTTLRVWATENHVRRDLEGTSKVLDDRIIGRVRTWLYRNDRSLIDILTQPDVPEEIFDAGQAWLEERAQRAHLAILEESRRAPGRVPPTEGPLRQLWDRVSAAHATLRAELVPAPSLDAARVRIETLEDPPRLGLIDGFPGICRNGARLELRLQGEPLTTCTCRDADKTRCPLALHALEHALDMLGRPEHPRRGWLVEQVGTPLWRRALTAIDAVIQRDAPERVLGWRIQPALRRVEPVECREKKRGAGVRLIAMAREELRALPDASLTEADRAVRTVLFVDRAHPPYARVLSLLAGHPRVFVDDAPVTIRKVSLGLEWSVSDNEDLVATVRLGDRSLPILDVLRALRGDDAWAELAVPDTDFIDVFHAEQNVAAVLGALSSRGPIFPAEARDAILERLPAMARLLPLRVAPTLRGAPRPADERPILRLDPRPDGGLSLSVFVRPMPGAPAFVPGAGPEELHGDIAGQRVYVARDLAHEVDAVRAALATLPLGDEGFTWTFSDPAAALDLLAAIQASTFTVEWVDPTRKRTAAHASAKNLDLRAKAGRGWLSLDGNLTVDDATIQLGEVLTAVLAGRRYVAVNADTWVRLSDELVEQLAGVAEAAETRGADLQLASLAAPLLDALQEAGAAVDAPVDVQKLMHEARQAEAWEPALPEGFDGVLRDYQRVGFTWMARLARWAPGACLADDMGLGKTIQTLALLVHRAPLGPALVVAPTSVGFAWLREAARFAPSLHVRAWRGATRIRAELAGLGPYDVLVTSWDLLARDVEPEDGLATIPFATFVLDEAQAIKNADTARAKAASKVQATFRLALSGTPVENRISELWALFRVVAPGLLGSWPRFRARFAVAIERSGDDQRRRALSQLIRPFLLRRLKRDVAKELPPRTDIVLEVELSTDEQRLYDAARIVIAGELAATDRPQHMQVLAAITQLRQLACHPKLLDPTSTLGSSKLTRLRELVAELRAEGHRVLVFSQFTRQLALVREALTEDGVSLRYLDGSTPEATRRAEVDAFQAGDGDVFLLSLKAGGTGLTLTAATYVIHLDPWWNPAVEDQASDRAHRIGQRQPVTVYRLVARGTIEEKILALHAEKRALVEGLLEGVGAGAALSVEELLALL